MSCPVRRHRVARLGLAWLLLGVLLAGCDERPAGPASDRAEPRVADTIFSGGDILTLEREAPQAEALAVADGRILAVGTREDVLAHRGERTRMIDLAGRTMMPGFIDSHSHLSFTAIKLGVLAMDPPPAGEIERIDDIVTRFRDALAERDPASTRWLVGWGYDHAMLEEGRHPRRADLDRVSRDVPILLVHFSTHQVVVNSRALELAGIDRATVDPSGGVIRRDPRTGEPDGILEEQAAVMMLEVASRLSRTLDPAASDETAPEASAFDLGTPAEEIPGLLARAFDLYASEGFTTALESAATPRELARLRDLDEVGELPIDVVAYPVIWATPPEAVSAARSVESLSGGSGDRMRRLRIGGGKVILDGGSPGRTAYLREPYHRQEEGESGYRGYPAYADASVVDGLVADYYARDVPLVIHALGDAAVDQAIRAIEAAERDHPGDERRTQLVHVQQAQPDQLARLAELDVTITFQVAHNYYFGDFHNDVIYGPERTARLNPARDAIDLGIPVTIHHDSPVHPVDQWTLIWAAVNRVTRSGLVIGPEQRIRVLEALEASTINAAHQIFEEERKGSLRAGKLADLIVLDRNPLEVDPMRLRELEVLETYKEGVRIHPSP